MFGIVQSCSVEKSWPRSQSDTLGKMGIAPAVALAVALHHEVPSKAALEQEYLGRPLEERSSAERILSVWELKRSDPAGELFHLLSAE